MSSIWTAGPRSVRGQITFSIPLTGTGPKDRPSSTVARAVVGQHEHLMRSELPSSFGEGLLAGPPDIDTQSPVDDHRSKVDDYFFPGEADDSLDQPHVGPARMWKHDD